MKTFYYAILMVSLALGGCSSSSTGSDAGVDGNTDGGVDGSDGDGSTGDDENCLPTGSACAAADDCCSQRCEGEICLGPTGLCFELGQECISSAECCSGRCETGPAGTMVCVMGGGCIPEGQACTNAVDCCSLSCSGGLCTTDDLCAVVGSECTQDQDCCSNDCTDSACAPSGATCYPLGETCTTDNSCCSGSCIQTDDGWRCTQVSPCRGEGDVCSEDSDCCSGVCGADGLCPELGECQTTGEPCTGFHECCSGMCADPGTGTPICTFLSGCRSVGELCLTDEQCCGSMCTEVPDTGLSRCEKPTTPGCLSSGEVCGGFNQGTSYNCCPSGSGGGSELCLETVMGVTRCFGEGTTETCIPTGEACSFADECCDGYCLPDPVSGELMCGDQCVEALGVCTTHADCCQDLICEDGTCQANQYGCFPVGAECQENEDCCTAECLNGHCGVS